MVTVPNAPILCVHRNPVIVLAVAIAFASAIRKVIRKSTVNIGVTITKITKTISATIRKIIIIMMRLKPKGMTGT